MMRRRIILSNLIGVPFFFIGLVFFNYSRASLLEIKLSSMIEHGNMIAAVLTTPIAGHYYEGGETIRKGQNGFFLRRPLIPNNVHARLFTHAGETIEDSRQHPPGIITQTPLPELDNTYESIKYYYREAKFVFIDWFYNLQGDKHIVIENNLNENIKHFTEVEQALRGTATGVIRITKDTMVLSVAVPVKNLEKILGALQLSISGDEIGELMRQDRNNLFILFLLAIGMSFAVSMMLAHNILTPIFALMRAVNQFHRANLRHRVSPELYLKDLLSRTDEIGVLSRAFEKMLLDIRHRIDEVENFAADVSHELKNPLTSLKNALETLEKIKDADKRERLLSIIQHDIRRIDRLIGDISQASRLDGQMQREKFETIELKEFLISLIENYRDTNSENNVAIELAFDSSENNYYIEGIEERLGQVFRNLLDNALSLTPQGGNISIDVHKDKAGVIISISDTGPGIAEDCLLRIFERFYSHRPFESSFGNHSGLGLSIVKQIILAHNGTITASNVRDKDGQVKGACFTIIFSV